MLIANFHNSIILREPNPRSIYSITIFSMRIYSQLVSGQAKLDLCKQYPHILAGTRRQYIERNSEFNWSIRNSIWQFFFRQNYFHKMASLKVAIFDRFWELYLLILLDLKPIRTSWSLFMFFLSWVFAFARRQEKIPNFAEYSKISVAVTKSSLEQGTSYQNCPYSKPLLIPCASPQLLFVPETSRGNISPRTHSKWKHLLGGYCSVVGSDAVNIDGYQTIQLGIGSGWRRGLITSSRDESQSKSGNFSTSTKYTPSHHHTCDAFTLYQMHLPNLWFTMKI